VIQQFYIPAITLCFLICSLCCVRVEFQFLPMLIPFLNCFKAVSERKKHKILCLFALFQHTIYIGQGFACDLDELKSVNLTKLFDSLIYLSKFIILAYNI